MIIRIFSFEFCFSFGVFGMEKISIDITKNIFSINLEFNK